MRIRLAAGCLSLALLGNLAPSSADSPPAPSPEQPWAFQPVRRPPVPAVRDRSWVRTPIDAFVLARLEPQGLRPAPPADRRTLLRRVYFDLIGLPPTPDEQQAFLQDASPAALARVVDDLLSRPQYGERWARHWLDVVRYAESNGYERDGAKPNAWRYRDYVIDAFNQDKPYDRFLTEQLAGDEIDGTNAETQIATTFLRLGTWDDEPADPLVDRYDQLDDVLGTTASAFLGLTLRCARCHNHKFEPFTQVDYYRMLAVFEPLKRPQKGRSDLDREIGTAEELDALRNPAAVRIQVAELTKTLRDRVFAQKKTALPAEAVAAFQTDGSLRTEAQHELIKKYTAHIEKEIRAAATPEENARLKRLESQLALIEASQAGKLPRAYIWYEEGSKAPLTHVFQRGNPAKPKKEVLPGVPAILVSREPDPPKPLARSSGRRLWLAHWMTRPEHPLTARVLVNRLWQGHFGKGLVATANDFGTAGEPPTHPELLDWLAAELVAGGWRLKPLHRQLVLSSTYQMASAGPPELARADPTGALLARWPQHRLEAEAVRDAILAVSGQLNPRMAGPSIFPPIARGVLESQSRPGEGWGKSEDQEAARRSIYIFVKRTLGVPELELLDAPDTSSSCEKRPVSTTGPQALTFLNGDFIHQQAQAFASRLLREAGTDVPALVQRAFTLALGRPPRPPELQAAMNFLARQRQQIETDARKAPREPGDTLKEALEGLCLVLLNTNEFVYLN
jgi:hypothetical protein